MAHAETFEYQIRKDVRNNPIVREFDERRQRELWSSLVIGAVLVLVVMFDAWQHFEHIRHGYEIDALQKALAAEDDVRRHLKLEIETLRAQAEVEPLMELATQLQDLKKNGRKALVSYLQNVRLSLYRRAKRVFIEGGVR